MRFFVLSLKAGGAGLNLTAASHVVHFDRWWNPAVENQATDRAFRIGQTKNVLVHKFVCRGTVEEKIDQLIESKRQLSTGFAGRRRRPAADGNERRGAAQAGGARYQQGAEGDVIDGRLLGMETLCFGGGAAAESRCARWRSAGRRAMPVSPVVIEGRTIVKTFWGKAWCENLERYSDFANRLPRGRTYVRNGSVIDLQIAPGEIKALVSGSEIYEVDGESRAGRARRAGNPSARTARARSIRWSSCCRAGFPRASWSGSAGRRPACSRRRRRSSFRAVVRTGPTCASMSRPCSTASARGSTSSPNSSSGCTTWTKRS